MRKYDEFGDAMRGFLLFAMFFLLLGAGAAAQGEPGHPKIGLVLSGGGARGLAHIGVLKALEEAHIPIDAIAGTSMGAVIGGLYASGYSADEIAHLAQTVDWGSLLSDTPPRKDIPFRRKQDDRLYLVKNGLNFRSDGTIGLPRGAIQGQNLSLTLEKLLVRSAATPDFDHLPIPFRAVAADIVHDQKVVFSKGHLPQALLASAAIPGVFAPVEVNGRLLVDGGMVDSLPVDVARQMGVDVVIAVDIGAPLRSRTQLRNVLDILSQSVTIVSRRNTEAQIATLKSTDVLLRPNLEGYGFADFAKAKQIIDVGYQAAKASKDCLLALRRPDTRPATALASNTHPAPLIINNIRIINNSSVSDAVIRDKIHQNVGQPLDLDQLQKDMGTLYGLDYFEQVLYQVEPENGGNTLVIDARQKRDGIDYLRLGVNLSDDFKGEGVYNIGGSFRKNGINRLGAEWLTRLQLGDEQEFFTEFYQPLDAGSRWFVAPNLFAESRNIDNTLDNDPVSRYRLSRYGYALNLGRQITNNGELRFGVGQDWGHSRPRIGPRDLPEEEFDEGFYDLRYSFDTEDNVDYPLHGERIDAHIRIFDESLGSDDSYRQWHLSVEKPLTFGPNTFLLGGQYARTGGGHPNLISSTMLLGGAQQLSGFRKDSLSGQNLGLARLIYYRRINSPSLLPLDYPLYLGASLEHGRIWNNDNDFDSGGINAASLFLGYLTPFGPMNVSFGFNDESERALYFNLGRSF